MSRENKIITKEGDKWNKLKTSWIIPIVLLAGMGLSGCSSEHEGDKGVNYKKEKPIFIELGGNSNNKFKIEYDKNTKKWLLEKQTDDNVFNQVAQCKDKFEIIKTKEDEVILCDKNDEGEGGIYNSMLPKYPDEDDKNFFNCKTEKNNKVKYDSDKNICNIFANANLNPANHGWKGEVDFFGIKYGVTLNENGDILIPEISRKEMFGHTHGGLYFLADTEQMFQSFMDRGIRKMDKELLYKEEPKGEYSGSVYFVYGRDDNGNKIPLSMIKNYYENPQKKWRFNSSYIKFAENNMIQNGDLKKPDKNVWYFEAQGEKEDKKSKHIFTIFTHGDIGFMPEWSDFSFNDYDHIQFKPNYEKKWNKATQDLYVYFKDGSFIVKDLADGENKWEFDPWRWKHGLHIERLKWGEFISNDKNNLLLLRKINVLLDNGENNEVVVVVSKDDPENIVTSLNIASDKVEKIGKEYIFYTNEDNTYKILLMFSNNNFKKEKIQLLKSKSIYDFNYNNDEYVVYSDQNGLISVCNVSKGKTISKFEEIKNYKKVDENIEKGIYNVEKIKSLFKKDELKQIGIKK